MQAPDDHPIANGMAAVTEQFYAELRRIAEGVFASERRDHTLQPTAVVNEACLRIMNGGLPAVPREQQLALAGRVLRQVLIDHARARNALKRGSNEVLLTFDASVPNRDLTGQASPIEFDRINVALDRLRLLSERQAEVVNLRIFSGLTMEQIASVIGVSKRSVEGDWTVARAWLRRELASSAGESMP